MKKAFDQYPEVYVKSHTKYSYYTDSREKITLEVGKDGITEEWIAELKQMHREEMNMMRRGRSKGAGKNYLLSLTQFEDELADKTGALVAADGSAEEEFIAEEDQRKMRRQIFKIYKGLSDQQRRLLIEVRSRGRTMTEMAKELGISRQAISKQLNQITDRFTKGISD